MNEKILILMQLLDFERIKLREGMKNCFCVSLLPKKLKASTGNCFVEKVF